MTGAGMRLRWSWLALLALLTPCLAAAQARSGVYRIYQGDGEIGRETFHANSHRLDLTVTIPLLNVRIASHLDWDDTGQPATFESLVRSLDPDSLRATITATLADTSRLTMTGAPGNSEQVIVGRPDFVMPGQSVVAAAELARRFPVPDTSIQLLLPGSPGLMPARVRSRGDSAVVSLAGVEIHVSHVRSDSAVITIPAQRVRAVLSREDSLPPLAGLRRPTPDYSAPPGASYTTLEVRVPISAAGDTFSLAGTLTLPRERRSRVPLVVFVSGSGGQPRDEELWPLVPDYRPFREIAAALADAGIASYRYDDRGVDASTGDPAQATTQDFTDDLLQVVRFLRTRAEVDPARVAILGHSEGGIMAPLAATRDSALRALVLLAGPGKSGREILADQFRYPIETAQGLSTEERARQLEGVPQSVSNWAAANPWTRWLAAYDPIPTARQVKLPVLILQGALDRQVSAGQADTLAAGFRSGGNRDVTVKIYPGLNHLFLPTTGDGSPTEYGSLRTVQLPKEVVRDIVEWLGDRLGSGR